MEEPLVNETRREDVPSSQRTPLRNCRKRWPRLVVVSILLCCLATVAVVAGLYWSDPLLTIEHQPTNADTIVLLGGEPTYRPPRALELYKQHLASKIIVSGDGDGHEAKRWLAAKNVPEIFIRTETKSENTKQNADLTIPMLRVQSARRVIIVTSWFHSRRALACFKKGAPEIQFISLPTIEDRPKPHWPNKYERKMVLLEYLKLAWYWVRYGVWAF
jgi:uncharacterized SAM-binding protein YcdF (DUF218 family)